LDKLGRVLIPDYLKEYASLNKNVTLLGLSTKIEIWDTDKWQEHKKRTESSAGDIAERLKELGI
jgi:MraZ protein